MTLLQKYRNWKNTPTHAKLSFRNIYAFLQGTYRAHIATTDTINEQVEWRKTQLDPICKAQGYCKSCGCGFPDKLYEDRGCSEGCYLDIMNAHDWEQFQKYIRKHNINQL